MKRKTPIRHTVRGHTREGKHIKSFERGKGTSRSNRRTVGRDQQLLTKTPRLSTTILNTMMEIIHKSIEDGKEYGADIEKDRLVNIEVGYEEAVRPGIEGSSSFHTHPGGTATASDGDILEMIEYDRAYTCIGALSREEKLPTVSCYSISMKDRKKGREGLNKLPVLLRKSYNEVMRLGIEVPMYVRIHYFRDNVWHSYSAKQIIHLGMPADKVYPEKETTIELTEWW